MEEKKKFGDYRDNEEVLRIEDLVVHYETIDGVAEALNGIKDRKSVV